MSPWATGMHIRQIPHTQVTMLQLLHIRTFISSEKVLYLIIELMT